MTTRTCGICRGSGYLTWTKPDRAPETKECYNCCGNGYLRIYPPTEDIDESRRYQKKVELENKLIWVRQNGAWIKK